MDNDRRIKILWSRKIVDEGKFVPVGYYFIYRYDKYDFSITTCGPILIPQCLLGFEPRKEVLTLAEADKR